MARIRSVHPGLFTDEAFVGLSADAQVFFIGLWTEADDQGVFEWKPLQLKMRLRGGKDGPVEPILEELRAANCIASYELSDRKYGVVRNFRRFQRPKKPNCIHLLPDEFRTYAGLNSPQFRTGDGSSRSSTEPEGLNGHDSTEPERVKEPPVPPDRPPGSELSSLMEGRMEDGGKEKGEREKIPSQELFPENNNQDTRKPRKNGHNREPYAFEAGVIKLAQSDFDKWKKAFPNIALEAELLGLAAWAEQQPKWFHAVSGALAKKQREAMAGIERAKADAAVRAQGPPKRLYDPAI